MKIILKVIYLSFAILSVQANASHSIECRIAATVTQLEDINRLNGSSTYSRSDQVERDRDVIVTVKVDGVEIETGRTPGCVDQSKEVKLLVTSDDIGSYKVGDALILNYSDVSDRPVTTISWTELPKLVGGKLFKLRDSTTANTDGWLDFTLDRSGVAKINYKIINNGDVVIDETWEYRTRGKKIFVYAEGSWKLFGIYSHKKGGKPIITTSSSTARIFVQHSRR